MKNLTYLKTSKTIFLKIFRMSIKQVYIAPGIYWGVIIKEWGGCFARQIRRDITCKMWLEVGLGVKGGNS
jgi:hypothetical protein